MQLGVFEIFERANALSTDEERVQYLSQFADNVALQTMIVGALHPGVQWLLPKTNPPYNPCDPVGAETFLYKEVRRLYLFAEGGHPTLTQQRREALFIELLENVHPRDAELMLAMKDKKIPDQYDKLTIEIFDEAFPFWGLIEHEEEPQAAE